MTRFSMIAIATTALTATSAAAYTGVSPTLLASAENIAEEVGLDVDFTKLTDEQVVEIYAAGQNGNAAEQLQLVKAAVEGTGALMPVTERRLILVDADEVDGLMPMGENSVVASVQNFLDKRGLAYDASTLTDNQVAEIYFLAFQADSESEVTNEEIETVINS